jgi:hypothetical protein
MHCAVPSFFGFFVSREHLAAAGQFYEVVVDSGPEVIMTELLQPFFQSPATFRFIESCLSRFMSVLNSHPRFVGTDPEVIVAVGYFLHALRDAAPLLPRPVVELVVRMQRAKWRTLNFTMVLMESFIIPMSFEWIAASAAAFRMVFMRSVLEFVTEDAVCHQFLQLLFNESFACVELPSLRIPLGATALDYFVSAGDIRLLVKVLQTSRSIPKTVIVDELLKHPQHYDHLWYHCAVYPHHRSLARESVETGLFHVTFPGVVQLEKLVDARYHKRGIEAWLEAVQAHEECTIAPYLAEIVSNPVDDFLSRYQDALTVVGIPRLAQSVWLNLVGANITRWIGHLRALLEHLDTQFSRLKGSDADFARLLKSVSTPKRRIVTGCVSQLEALQHLKIPEQFSVLISVAEKLLLLQGSGRHAQTLLPDVIRESARGTILSTYLILNGFAMRIHSFGALCSDKQHRAWLKMESAILQVLHSDTVFLSGFVGVQESITQIAEINIHDLT